MLFSTVPLSRKPKGTDELLPMNRSIAELVDMVERAHAPIADCFFKGLGHDAQFIESEIMVSVLLRLKSEGVVALPVHDALIVAESDEKAAYKAMVSQFKLKTGVSAEVTVHHAH